MTNVLKLKNTVFYSVLRNETYDRPVEVKDTHALNLQEGETPIKLIIHIHENQDRNAILPSEYWGVLDMSCERVSMILPYLEDVKRFSPDGFKEQEENGEIKLIRLELIDFENHIESFKLYLNEKYTEEYVDEMIEEQKPEYLSEEELEEHDGDVYSAYADYGRGEAEDAARAEIIHDYSCDVLKINPYHLSFEEEIAYHDAMIEVFDSLDSY